ncbi:MAG: hypothetical protein WBH05_14735, partial [Syntrophobacteria bacterium]
IEEFLNFGPEGYNDYVGPLLRFDHVLCMYGLFSCFYHGVCLLRPPATAEGLVNCRLGYG